jgi:hypothetical protein
MRTMIDDRSVTNFKAHIRQIFKCMRLLSLDIVVVVTFFLSNCTRQQLPRLHCQRSLTASHERLGSYLPRHHDGQGALSFVTLSTRYRRQYPKLHLSARCRASIRPDIHPLIFFAVGRVYDDLDDNQKHQDGHAQNRRGG